MTARLAPRLATTLEWLLLGLCSALLVTHTLPKAWRTLNTDFPNYYLAAQLAHQGYDTAQAYDWRWLQREKDHRLIDQRLVGLAPITPFSTLFVWPLTGLQPLRAKHLWLILQLALLVPIVYGIRDLTGQPLRRIALLATACFPLHRNLVYGQFYILLLAMIVAACWAYHRQRSALSGVLVALATMTKIFPGIFLLYFLRKRDWRALTAAVLTCAACLSLSIAVFGWSMHRTYLQVILPWTLRGEALPPYLLASSSLSTLLHRLFIFEPQWNPHPWHNAPALAAILGPTLHMLILAPAILLLRPARSPLAALEWSTLLGAALAISTSPASYNFILLLLPTAVLCATLRPRNALVAVLLYLGIGYPSWNTANVDGLRAILHEPRLLLLLAFVAICLWTLARTASSNDAPDVDRRIGYAALTALLCVGIVSALRHQRNLYDDYAFRLPMQPDALFSASPAIGPHGLQSVSLQPDGYRLTLPSPQPSSSTDQLSFASTASAEWVEDVSATSQILPAANPHPSTTYEGRSPQLSPDGQLLAYIHDRQGRGQLLSPTARPLTPPQWNVLDAAPAPDGTFYVAATEGQRQPAILHLAAANPPQPPIVSARYPSPSPDGRWLAYSRFLDGNWNLWLLDLSTRQTHRLASVPCNQVEPSWEADSKTLLYASDCGRALGFTALCRRKVVPE